MKTKLLIAILILQLLGCQSEKEKYQNETIDYIKEINLNHYELKGSVKSVTTFKDLSISNQNNKKYFYPKFYAEFNKEGKLSSYIFYNSGMTKDTAYIRNISYSNNSVIEKGTYENYKTVYNAILNPVISEKRISEDKYNSRYRAYFEKREYDYDAQNRLLSSKYYVQKRPKDTLVLSEQKDYVYSDDNKTEYYLRFNQKKMKMDTFSTKTYKVNDKGFNLSYNNTSFEYENGRMTKKTVKNFEEKIEKFQYQNDLLAEYTLTENGVEYQKTLYDYDDHGYLSKRMDYANGKLTLSSTFEYIYDNQGNWTKKIVKSTLAPAGLVVNRKIDYW